MATRKRTVSVRLERAAELLHQSRGAFLQHAGDVAVSRYRQGGVSFSELAGQTALTVEEIMAALGEQGREEALAQFLVSCRTVAELRQNPEVLRPGEEAVETIGGAR